jgi:parallel beta-helix repeat protein
MLPTAIVASTICLLPCLSWSVDSDGDGLSDYIELHRTGTDPFDWDTDDDGLGDLELPELVTWGRNNYGQTNVPARALNAVALSAGYEHNLALLSDGNVVTWGRSDLGQTNVLAQGTNAVAVSAGHHHNMALLADFNVSVWGYSSYGITNIPPQVMNPEELSGGGYHCLARLADGSVVSWGRNNHGQTNVPVQVSNAVEVAGGFYHSLAVLTNGTVIAWGYNNHGQTNVPSAVTNAVSAAGDGYHSMALLDDGRVTAWGYNNYGQINVPAQVTNAVAIAAGFYHNAALRSDGTVVVWGRSSEGQTVVPDRLTNAVAVTAGGWHCMALQITGDPLDPDMDDDGIPDGWEVAHALNPRADDADLDSDGDGLTNLGEYIQATDPWDGDSDGDGLSDGDEIHVYGTDPLVFNNVRYVDINNSLPVPPYGAWSTAATNIQDAVDAAAAGDLVLVTNGVYGSGTTVTPPDYRSYSSLNRLIITSDITVHSVNGPEYTYIVGEGPLGPGAVRGVYMSAGKLSGFTITNGHTAASGYSLDRNGGGVNMLSSDCLVINCALSGNLADNLGGGSLGGTLTGCTITDNSAYAGGGSYGGTLKRCIISANTAHSTGGGSDGGTLSGCALSGNTALYGGGSHDGVLINCTVTGNSADYGGGSFDDTLTNCIVYHNNAWISGDNFYADDLFSQSTLNYCCTTPMPSGGVGNITDDPMLLDTAHILAGSSCIGAGSAAAASGTDIDGDSWAAPPSIGCDEPVTVSGELEVAIRAAYRNAATGYALDFAAEIVGEAISNRWSFGDGFMSENAAFASHAWVDAGAYDVTLTAYNETYPEGVSATVAINVVEDSFHYVSADSANPVPPYTSWATAALTIQDAVDVAGAIPGSVVLVGSGVYSNGTTVAPGGSSLNRVVITADITVQSADGPEATFILGAEAPGGGSGAGAVRGVYMSAGMLSGFTVTNGHTATSGSLLIDLSGGGVNLPSGYGVVSNCVLSGNLAEHWGGGSSGGTLKNCMISGNSASSSGGGSYYSTATGCILSGNTAIYGGGCYGGTLHGCTISGNSADVHGGGSYLGTLNNCMISGNAAFYAGGGSYNSTVNGCNLSGNTANYGGGSYDGTLNGCTITRNLARFAGGGSYSGSYGGTLTNCIVYYNNAFHEDDNYGGSITMDFCCTTPIPSGGSGNFADNPMLLDSTHIHAASPCVGAGSPVNALGTDIDGDPWGMPPSIGCDEPFTVSGELEVFILASHTNATIGYALDFAAEVSGESVSNLWSFGDGSTLVSTAFASHSWTGAGIYEVTLIAYNETYPEGVASTVVVSVVEDAVHYVSADSTNPVPPYTSWTTAAANIQDAVDAVSGVLGSTILVTNGTYNYGTALTPGYSGLNRVAITSDIHIKSVNGPEETFIVGAQAPGGGIGMGAVRGVYMSAGVLSGFTITNGHTHVSGDDYYERSGGGVLLFGGNGIVTNCVLSGNFAAYGGGSSDGTLFDCVLSGNWATISGGGSDDGLLNGCIITGNSAVSGGGSYMGTLNGCVIMGNSALDEGGGSYRSDLNGCTLMNNSASLGGGISYSTVNGCILSGNAANYGGGSYSGTLIGCTLSGNSAADFGGGSYEGTLTNCIVYSNSAASGGPNWYGTDPEISYSCTTPNPGGNGNITNNPLFAAAGDFHLQVISPCIDAGINQAWMVGATDLDGNPRIVGEGVDMGAYEYPDVRADTDGDGLLDVYEIYLYGTDPLDADSDDDGLIDGEEINIHGTDPLDADCDDDGISDNDEIENGLDPLNSNVGLDSDSDGLSDADEVNIHGTDPLDADTDDDWLMDGGEIYYGSSPHIAENQYTSNSIMDLSMGYLMLQASSSNTVYLWLQLEQTTNLVEGIWTNAGDAVWWEGPADGKAFFRVHGSDSP